MSRLACLLVPLFPLAARLRCEPELKGEAAAVAEGNGPAARVVAATRRARDAGVKPGMTLAQARALLPKLLARARDREGERAAQEALFEAAESVSPRVEDAGDGCVYADVEGLSRLFPDERDLGRALVKAAETAGLPARAGIASGKLAARVAAGLPGSPVVVPPEKEPEFLAPLPLSRLVPGIDLVETLRLWGVRTAGELARLPAAEVSRRLGAAGEALYETARGFDPSPLVPRPAPPCFSEGMDLDWPVVTLEPFLAFAGNAIERLCLRLAAEALGCTRLEAELRLDPDGHDVRAVVLPAPTRDPKTLRTLLQMDLEARPPGAPVTGFTLTAHPDRPRRGQMTLFGATEVSPDLLATALAHLAALLGPGRAGSPRPADSHLPGRYDLLPFAPPPPPSVRRPQRPGRGLLAVRLLDPPVPLEVMTDEVDEVDEVAEVDEADETGEAGETVHGGEHARRPRTVRSLVPEEKETGQPGVTSKVSQIKGAVRVASGPWNLEEGWWTAAPAARHYWDVELEGGLLCRLYRDTRTSEWFADGTYD